VTDDVAPSPSTEPDHDGPDHSTDAAEPAINTGTGLEPGKYATELVEVFPNVVAVLGELPADLEGLLEPLNTGLLTTADLDYVTKTLTVVGNSAAVGGNLAQTAAGFRGLYRIVDESQALLNAGGRLAAKDGANLGTILLPKGFAQKLAQARFTPATGLTAAGALAAIGPVLAMVGLQAQLNQVSTLVKKNIALTSQVIESTRRAERATLVSLVDTIEQALQDAQAAESVPRSLWDTVASKKADLRAERKKYRDNVEAHVGKIAGLGVHQRRQYLETNARSVVFDAFALLSTIKAWTGYQAIAAAVAREAGAEDPAEAKHFESIVANTRRDFEADLREATRLVGALTRELHIIVQLPVPAMVKMSSRRKDAEAARGICLGVLDAIAPLSDALLKPRGEPEPPEVVCAPMGTDIGPYLNILHWLLEANEHIRCLGIGEDAHPRGAVAAVVGAARDKIAWTLDRDPARELIVVTDRRILVGETQEFLQRAVFSHERSLDSVRYVRSAPKAENATARRVDLITSDTNHAWHFESSGDVDDVDLLAAVLAEAMTLPEREREELLHRGGVARNQMRVALLGDELPVAGPGG
jgi:hypothetical protein